MATQSPNARLLDELIETFARPSATEGRADLVRIRQTVDGILKDSKAGRTNQFAVIDHYKGLEEKARVNNYAELADALQDRVEALKEKKSKWTPELLSLLYELADNPISNALPEDLNLLAEGESPPLLTWDDILRDDPFDNEDGLWDNVDFGEGSSVDDEDLSADDRSIESESSADSVTPDDALIEIPMDARSATDFQSAEAIQAIRLRWKETAGTDSDKPVTFSETQIIRETIFMLLGLPCDAYVEGNPNCVRPNTRILVKGVSAPVLLSVLSEYSEIGNFISVIRRWAQARQSIHVVQAFQASLNTRLNAVNFSLSRIETRVIHADSNPITLLSVFSEIQAETRHLIPLAGVIKDHEQSGELRPFGILEAIFRMIRSYQSIGDFAAYKYTAVVFFEVFDAYFKPMRKWMATGEVDTWGASFFVKESEQNQPLNKLWSDQFILVYDMEGNLHAPDFLHVAVHKIFVAGKSFRFLRALGEDLSEDGDASPLDLSSIIEDGEAEGLLPFQGLFNARFDAWISKQHRSSSNRLRTILNTRCGLRRNLDALEYVYFGNNGAVNDQAIRPIFEGIDNRKPGWDNQFILTGLFQETFGQLSVVDAERISVRVNKSQRTPQPSPRSIHRLESIELTYLLPWATSNIIKQDSIHSYQKVHVLLLQIQRAKQLLDIQTLRNIPLKADHTTRTDILLSFLRHRLRWYVDTLQSYFAIALSLTNKSMRTKMDAADDLDRMISVHNAFVQNLETRSLVASRLSSTHQAVIAVLDLVVLFSDTCSSVRRDRIVASLSTGSKEGGSQVGQEVVKDEEITRAKIEKLVATYSGLLTFVLAGVREAGRKEGDEFLKMLADNLAFGIKTQGLTGHWSEDI